MAIRLLEDRTESRPQRHGVIVEALGTRGQETRSLLKKKVEAPGAPHFHGGAALRSEPPMLRPRERRANRLNQLQ